jgi:hypothetical protein
MIDLAYSEEGLPPNSPKPVRVKRLALAASDLAAHVDERRLQRAQGSMLVPADRIRELVAALEELYPGVLAYTRQYHGPSAAHRRNHQGDPA